MLLSVSTDTNITAIHTATNINPRYLLIINIGNNDRSQSQLETCDLTIAKSGPLTLLLSAGALVLGRDVHDAIGVDVKGDLNLRDATRGGGDPHKGELTQHLVVRRHLPLALAHLDLHLGLSVCSRGKHLRGHSGTMLAMQHTV